ncbi:disease resistance protein RPM1-like [Quercus suber]|uniref:disease resistance protein RPM1-like n=1 Tax=Quercus suber TaxID=58331 RepID=UPI0032DFCE63
MKSPLPGMDSMDEESLILSLRNYLQQKRYVVVFDNIQKIDFWEDIKHVLPDNNKASRIIITTRKCEVVNFCKKSCPVYAHQLQPLPPKKAWELFYKRAFRNDFGGHCPLELEELSQEIVEKCQGLQLAITSIGGLLSTKHKTLSEWRNLHDNLAYESGINPHLAGVHKVLSLSYEDLPYHLKSCLLYFGMYPENFRISCRTLIRQWIVEGFVNEIKDKTLEEIGQEYLTELIDKSLVQVLEVDVGGEVIVCGIHDLLHEIILQKMEDLGFCHVLSKGESSFEEPTRRMLVHRVSYGVFQSFKKSPIHSLLFFNIDELPKSFMSSFFKNFKLMKVLDFESTPLDHLPEDVGNLFHLKYLNLNGTKVKTLPKSFVKLQNLETLSLEQTLIQELPFAINKLHKLRCLLAYYFDDNMDISLNILRGVKIHGSIGCLRALGNLRYVDANLGGVKLVEDLGKLSQLKDLGLVNLTRETGRALCTSIENMNSLTDLYVSLINEDKVVDLQPISSPPKCLRKLSMKGRLAKLPEWISELQHLLSINFYWTRLSDDPLKAFQNLPNLAELILEMEAYNGEQLQIRKGGFPKLKVLGLADLTELISLNISKEALPILEKLSIERCPQLMEVPSGVQHLRNLSELIFTDMPSEFEQSLDPKQGSHYWIIEHVPFIFLRHKVRKGIFGYETHNLSSKYLERSKGTTINQVDDTNSNNGDDINASDDKGKQIIST